MQPFALFTGLYLALATIALGSRRSDYSHVRNTLSELGEVGAPGARLVSWAVFAPVGCALAIVGACAWSSDRALAQLSLCLGVGYLGSALFPCDRGAPLSGSWRQNVHSALAAIAYVGGALALLQLSMTRDSVAYLAAAVVVSLATVCASLPFWARARGLVQRVAELVLFAAWALSVE